MSLPAVPARWREDDPTSAQMRGRRRRVAWLLALVAVLAGSAGFLLPYLHPATRCRLVPLFISYPHEPLPPLPWRGQDRDGLIASETLAAPQPEAVPSVLDQASVVGEL